MIDNIMLDIETLGNGQNSVIVSIGAVKFDLETGEIGEKFYKRVDIQSCLNLGLQVMGETIAWWMQQNDAARAEFGKATVSLIECLDILTEFITPIGEDPKKFKVWGNPASFDLGIVSNAYNKTGLPVPWFYRNERDIRTLVGLNPAIKDSYPKQTTEQHHPIIDCIYQISVCCETWNSLQIKQAA